MFCKSLNRVVYQYSDEWDKAKAPKDCPMVNVYKLIQYYLCQDDIKFHIVTIEDTEQEVNNFKTDLIIWLNKNNIETYEIIETQNINSIKKELKNENTFYFGVINS